jgi:hypothetical protein
MEESKNLEQNSDNRYEKLKKITNETKFRAWTKYILYI